MLGGCAISALDLRIEASENTALSVGMHHPRLLVSATGYNPYWISVPPPASHPPPNIFKFGVFEFNARTTELLKGGTGIRLQPQPARLLKLLLHNAGELVTRDDIREALWDGETNVDFEVGVNRCVRQLRTALLDDIGSPRYIKTIPRLGYCFIGPVSNRGTVTSEPHPNAPETSAAVPRVPTGQQSSIVVLPFANLSGVEEDEHFSDGLSEEIINTLAQIPGLKVIARTSAFAFKGKNEDIRKIAQTLGVSNVLEGSVRRSGARIRITAQLIHAADGTHLSSKRYDREITDIFAVQDELSAEIAGQLRCHLVQRRRSTTSPAAYQVFLEGRFHWQKFMPAGFLKSFECFQRAVAMDPSYGPAHAGIAMFYFGMALNYAARPRKVLPKAEVAARTALELDESDAEALTALGHVDAMLDFNWDKAGKYLLRARELSPAPNVRMGFVMFYLIPRGRIEDAVREADEIIGLDPLHLVVHAAKGLLLIMQRKYDAAAMSCQRALDIDPATPPALECLAYVRALQGHFEEAVALAERRIDILGRSPLALTGLAIVHALAGNREAVYKVIREVGALSSIAPVWASGLAGVHALLGENDPAFEWMDVAVRESDPRLSWLETCPWFDGLRSDPRYPALLTKLNLPVR